MIKKLVSCEKHEVPSGETLFHWIGPLFHRIGRRVSPDGTFSKTIALNQTKHSVCQNDSKPKKYRLLFTGGAAINDTA